MTRDLYIRETRQESPLLRRLMIGLLLPVLLVSLVIGALIHWNGRKAEGILDDFQLAMQQGRYRDGVELYRQARDRELGGGLFDRNQALYSQAVAAMEQQTDAALDEIVRKLSAGQMLGADEIRLAEEMAELSAARLITRLRGLCREYLFGQIERFVLEQAFGQLGSLSGISQGVGSLPAEFDAMAAARPIMSAANAHLAAGDFWPAYRGYQELLEEADWSGFIREQALVQQEQCRQLMYTPLLDEAMALLDGGRLLSAGRALSSLLEVFPDDPDIRAAAEFCAANAPASLSAYSGPIEFIVIKPLINQPERAFDGDAYAAAAADAMITTGEFTRMLEQLYQNQFILVDASSLYGEDRRLSTLQLPPGKKPLVLVIEGLNYYASRRETGNAWNLVLDEGGEVSAEYPDSSGRMIIDRRGEAIGLLDEFVARYPDFSLDGAKGTISLTGYECIFGYVTDPDQLDDRNKALTDNNMAAITVSEREMAANRETVRQIIERLKATGWLFASSTYGFIDARSQDMARIVTDTQKWLDQVGSLTGPVSMLHYPNGAFITGSDERAEYLKDQGFILFGGIGATPYLFVGNRYIYVDKVPVNGYTLRNSKAFQLDRLFSAAAVYDSAVRK
jgi:hypothetical protein